LSFLRRYLPLVTLAIAIAALYLYDLDGVGVLGPDEPRYIAIGRAMAHSGDLVTPVLWGSPWFEKPPLLYWMTAAGTASGLGPELSGRLPVALLSLAFLAASFFLLRAEFGLTAAGVSVALLASCAAWITYSSFALTDLPLAVFFSLALFLVLPLQRPEPLLTRRNWRLTGAAFCLAFATLAKGLVPPLLALPLLWFLRRFWRDLLLPAGVFLLVALPWYIAVYLKNGSAFVDEFFLKHHLERLYSPSLQHAQPWYYYVPVILAAVFPWTPLLSSFRNFGIGTDRRLQLLLSTVCFGFVFFSISLNKLAGYLLPLLPSLFVLIGVQVEQIQPSRLSRWWYIACATLASVIPFLSTVLPQVLSAGRLTWVSFRGIRATEVFYIALPLVVVFLARRSWRGALLVLSVIAGAIYLKSFSYPLLDRDISARGLWREKQEIWSNVCDGGTNRDWLYGLTFYRGSPFPPCDGSKAKMMIHSYGNNAVSLLPR
jgi:4-amino-4-deoxy-L-arabinose transferase-like glycosyltransferase